MGFVEGFSTFRDQNRSTVDLLLNALDPVPDVVSTNRLPVALAGSTRSARVRPLGGFLLELARSHAKYLGDGLQFLAARTHKSALDA